MADEPDLLSQLPDELLQHIIRHAPCREAESTAVLSRRWRGVWPPPTGAIKIDIPSASFHTAEEALAASHGPVARLAIHVGEHCNNFLDIVGDVLSPPASRGVQDVRIRARTSRGVQTAADSDDDDSCSRMPYWSLGEFRFSFFSVPSAALRVLHITNCSDHTTTTPPLSTATFFPCLEVLRLRRCSVTLERLQDMVVASPQLAALQLEYVCLVTGYYTYSDDDDDDNDVDYDSGRWVSTQSFCCPAISTLVLLNCFCEQRDGSPTELDVPRVQHFKYRGKVNQFTLRSPLPDARRADLHILDSYPSGHTQMGERPIGHAEKCERFWSFLKNFSGTKVLKLKLEWPIDYVAALERGRIWDLLICENETTQSVMFCVEDLEIDALYYPNSKDVGVAIGNLLQCCPGLHDFRLKLNKAHQRRRRSKGQLEFHRSIDHFRRRRDRPVVPLCGDDGKFEVSDILGLSDRWIHFSCLQFHLKKLSLQFHMDKANKPNSFGVRLVKFFIKRGMALEEIYIHDGNTKMWEHMNCKIIGYSANPQPISEHQFFTRMSQALSMNRFSRSKINGCFHPHKLEVRRTNPWFASKSFTVFPLADT